jgi:uncharacterized membrane protein
MSERLALESWQLAFPAIGIVLFIAVFLWSVVRVVRMKRPTIEHMLHLPMEQESSRPASHVRPE